jgi:hypothetical protein
LPPPLAGVPAAAPCPLPATLLLPAVEVEPLGLADEHIRQGVAASTPATIQFRFMPVL